MKWSVVIGAVAVVCAVLHLGGVNTASQAAASSETMYRVEEVIGTLVAGRGMYEAAENTWYLVDLRVEEGKEGLRTGLTYPIKYVLPTLEGRRAPALGDRIRIKLWQAAPTEGWVASERPTVVGRGEFIRPGEGSAEDLGQPTARILVKMLAPLATDCHRKTAELLRQVAARYPDKVRVQLFDMAKDSGRGEIRRERLNCASVLVNNRFQFTISTPAGDRKVLFQHRPNDPNSAYNSEDVVTVVEQELRRLYPEK